MRFYRVAAFLLVAIASVGTFAQQIDLGPANTAARSKRQHVELISDNITVSAGKPQDIDVIFRVDPGFHINSHEPKDELLIPTALKLSELAGLKILSQHYPRGTPFQVSTSSETEHLDVYTGEFRVGLRVVVPYGATILNGTLHYQACDSAACFPPRDLPITFALHAK